MATFYSKTFSSISHQSITLKIQSFFLNAFKRFDQASLLQNYLESVKLSQVNKKLFQYNVSLTYGNPGLGWTAQCTRESIRTQPYWVWCLGALVGESCVKFVVLSSCNNVSKEQSREKLLTLIVLLNAQSKSRQKQRFLVDGK